MNKVAVTTLCLLVFIAPALAGPSLRWTKNGSAILGFASNSDTMRSYNCSGTITVRYKDFGEDKTTTKDYTTEVPAGAKDSLIFKWDTPWAGSTLDFTVQDRGCS
jgi:hypothetical protein